MLPPEKNDGNIEYKRYLLIKLNDQSIFKLNKENKTSLKKTSRLLLT